MNKRDDTLTREFQTADGTTVEIVGDLVYVTAPTRTAEMGTEESTILLWVDEIEEIAKKVKQIVEVSK